MTIKAVETIRHIRDEHAVKTQGLSAEDAAAFYRQKAETAMKKVKDLCGTNAVVAETSADYGTEADE
jgi:hypothetical protein